MADAVYRGDYALCRISQPAETVTQFLATDVIGVGCKVLQLSQNRFRLVVCGLAMLYLGLGHACGLWSLARTVVRAQKVL